MTMLRNLLLPTILTALFLALCCLPAIHAAEYRGVLREPVALGAWLYRSRCVRCHLEYERQRPAQEYEDQRELSRAIGSGGCRISWARGSGGEFNTAELMALAAYMLAWEENVEEPDLPLLPPLLAEKTQPVEKTGKPAKFQPAQQEKKAHLPEHLKRTVAHNEVARGGWLYTGNCYRCHLGYERARMCKGTTGKTVQRIISEGKTSTQMKPFSRMLGGDLRNSEIKAIVAYITTWEQKQEPLAIAAELMTPPAVDPDDLKPLRLRRFPAIKGSPEVGRKLYAIYCSTCHGYQREGYTGPSLSDGFRGMRPDLYVKSVLKTGIPGSLMQSWDTNTGGRFTPKQIEDVVSSIITPDREHPISP